MFSMGSTEQVFYQDQSVKNYQNAETDQSIKTDSDFDGIICTDSLQTVAHWKCPALPRGSMKELHDKV